MTNKPKPREVEIPDPAYQPSRAELAEDLRLEGTFEEAITALLKPAAIKRINPKSAPG